jgi:hypothetical protein
MRKLKTALMLMLLGLLLLASGFVAAMVWNDTHHRPLTPQPNSSAPTLQQVQSWATLVSTRVLLSDVVTARVDGFAGSIEALVVVRGDVAVGVDLQQATIQEVNQASRHLLLCLPQPRAQQPRVDHEHTRVFAIQRYGLWRIMRRDEAARQAIDAAFAEAQKAIEKAATEEAVLAHAREHAQEAISSLLEQMGWTAEIRWMAG